MFVYTYNFRFVLNYFDKEGFVATESEFIGRLLLLSTQASQKTRICRGCGSQFEPKIGASMQAYCFPSCRQKNNKNKKQAAAQTPTTTGNKRDGGHLSPDDMNSKKNKREDPNSKKRERTMFAIGQEDLMKLETAELTEIILSLRERFQKARQAAMEFSKAKLDLEKELTEVKVAFADWSLEAFRRGSGVIPERRSYASAAGGHTDGGIAILVAKVEASASPINLSKIDALLGSSLRGLVAQDVRQKDDKVIMTFSDSDSRKAARGILEGSQECKVLFSSVSSSTGYYPVIARYMNAGATEEAMLSDIRYRNPILK